MQSFQIGKNEAGQRLDKFLHKFMPSAPNSFIFKMLRKKNIVLNGKKAEGKEILAVDDTVSFFFSDETFTKFTQIGSDTLESTKPKSITNDYNKAYVTLKGITIIYEDEDILILNKPAGILTQKAESDDFSLNEWMIGYLLQQEKITEEALLTFKPSVQNRLDRNTSGLVLCGVSLRGSQILSHLIHDRTIKKVYLAIVKGKIDKPGILSGSLKKDGKTNKVIISDTKGKEIITSYKPISFGKDYTLLEIELITGKTHQIRAHMASIGHPILGDPKYGDIQWNQIYKKKLGIKRQLLHAYRVEFPNMTEPFIKLSNQEWIAPLPDDIQEVIH